jgi:membrane associated rhomboid family serine protease
MLVRFPAATIVLMVLCTGMYLTGGSFVQATGFVPVEFFYGILHADPQLGATGLSLLTAFFMHAGIVHLLSNMWYLWIFGGALEGTIGMGYFSLAYLACGIGSMVVQAAFTPFSTVPIVGASGAIAGIMGAHLVILPLAKVLMWFPPIFFLRIPSFVFLGLWLGIQYVSMRQAGPAGGGVAWGAHIGGFAAGFVGGIAIRQRRSGNRDTGRSRRRRNRRTDNE